MALTYTQHVGDGTNPIFTVPCPYIEQSHIRVKIGAFPCVLGAHYNFINPTQIRFIDTFVPVNGSTVEIRRQTPVNVPLVTFQDGAVLSDDDLNTATLQTLFITQEIKDYYEAALVGGFNRLNNGTATSAQDAIDAAVQDVLNSSLLSDLSSHIEDIELNAESIVVNTTAIVDMQTQLNALVDFGEGIDTLIADETAARIAGDTAIVTDLELIGAKNGAGTAFVLDLSTVQVGGGVSLGTRLTGIDAHFTANDATLASHAASIGTNTSGIATNAAAIVSANAAIATEATARASADGALSSTLTALTATVATNLSTVNASISSEASTRASADTALSSTLTALTSTVSTNLSTVNAAIASEASTRASADTALSSTLTALQSTVTSNYSTLQSQITSEASTRASGDAANASDITTIYSTLSGLSSTVGSNYTSVTAAISSEASTRASADGALSSTITTLQATVASGDSTLTAALAVVAGVVSGTGGLTSQYMVKTDVNGRVAGFGLYNTGATSEFIVLANKFAIVDPADNSNVKVPFTVSGGVVYMQNVVIGNAVIENAAITTAKIGDLQVDGPKVADGAVSTVKIEVDAVTQLFSTYYDFSSSPWDTVNNSFFTSFLNGALVVSHPSTGTHKVQMTLTFIAERDGSSDDNLDIRFYNSTGAYAVGLQASNVQLFGGFRIYTYQTVFTTNISGNYTYYPQYRSITDGSPFIKSFTFVAQVFKR